MDGRSHARTVGRTKIAPIGSIGATLRRTQDRTIKKSTSRTAPMSGITPSTPLYHLSATSPKMIACTTTPLNPRVTSHVRLPAGMFLEMAIHSTVGNWGLTFVRALSRSPARSFDYLDCSIAHSKSRPIVRPCNRAPVS